MSGQCVQLTSEGRRRVSDMTLRVVWERVVRVWRIRKIKKRPFRKGHCNFKRARGNIVNTTRKSNQLK